MPAPNASERRTSGDRRITLESTIGDGVGLYWRYEKRLRRLESAVGSTLGATGAIYAIRRALCGAAAGRHDPRRRAHADARGAGGLPRRVRRAGAGARPRAADADAEIAPQDPDARRQLPDSLARAAAARCRGATRCGSSTCRTRSDGCSCRTRCWRLLREPRRSRRTASSICAMLAGQVAFLGLAGYGALLDHRAPRCRRGVMTISRDAGTGGRVMRARVLASRARRIRVRDDELRSGRRALRRRHADAGSGGDGMRFRWNA